MPMLTLNYCFVIIPMIRFCFSKILKNTQHALDGITDGMTVAIGGFGICGVPMNLVHQLYS